MFSIFAESLINSAREDFSPSFSPLKLLTFSKTINVTLGLPIIRTSPGHGTAIDIAKDFKADFNSFNQAILFAKQMISSSLKSGSN